MMEPFACFAPSNLALISPDLTPVLKTLTGVEREATYSSSSAPR